VAVVLGDALRRVSVLGGREGIPRSLGSVYAASVTRFLGGILRGVASRVVDMQGVQSSCNGVAASVDGCTLLVSDGDWPGSHAIHEVGVADGSRRRVVGGEEGDEPLQFSFPCQVCIAPDGFVFVADYNNHRVQVLTPSLAFHCFIGEGAVSPPGVCANADVVVVSTSRHRIAVFNRCDGALRRRFGSEGTGDGQLKYPRGLCFVSGDRHVAVADFGNNRVSVFSIDGGFIRHIGVGLLSHPQGVAASVFDELVVADTDNRCLRVFSSVGEVLVTVGEGRFTGVAVRGSSVFAVDASAAATTVVMWKP
jgi:DNA-binding beta-propeller fold protein YncE